MEKPISVGDLVTYRKVCCDVFTAGVWIFPVRSIHRTRPMPCHCRGCNTKIPNEMCAAESGNYPGTPLSWLKRIPPLTELESVDEFKRDIMELTA